MVTSLRSKWAAGSWLFFRVARSTRMTQIGALYRQSGSDRLEKQPADLRRRHHYMRDGTLAGRATLLPEGIRKIGLFLANQGAASCRIQAYASIWKIKVNMNEDN